LVVDQLPGRDAAERGRRLRGRPKKQTVTKALTKLGLDDVKRALLQEFGRPLPEDAGRLAQLITGLVVRHSGPRQLDVAISTAGGVVQAAVTPRLMLKAMPGVFVAGEMLDWEAPTGGYLLTGCLATGKWAGDAAGAY